MNELVCRTEAVGINRPNRLYSGSKLNRTRIRRYSKHRGGSPIIFRGGHHNSKDCQEEPDILVWVPTINYADRPIIYL